MGSRHSAGKISLIWCKFNNLNNFSNTIGIMKLCISLSVYFSISLDTDFTALYLITVSSCAQSVYKIGKTMVCWAPSAGPTLVNSSAIANTT
jgi:hypothetical protein